MMLWLVVCVYQYLLDRLQTLLALQKLKFSNIFPLSWAGLYESGEIFFV